jgi:hypothetical protein
MRTGGTAVRVDDRDNDVDIAEMHQAALYQ